MTSWIFGAVAVLLALLGAILASRAIDVGMATFGYGLLIFGVLFAFWLMKEHYDEQDRSRPSA
ncbi:MAG TPA: hypothetical protein VEU47_02075 [Candidatus Cybelea sp.]|nr:hypothetical protein [Candidatus Cybelea sp.]